MQTSHQEMIHSLHFFRLPMHEYLFLDMCRILLYVTINTDSLILLLHATFCKNVDQQCLIIVFTTSNIKFIMFAATASNEILSKEWQNPGHVIVFSRKWAFWALQAERAPKKNFWAKIFNLRVFFYVFMVKKHSF